MDIYDDDDFTEQVKKPAGPRHARQVDSDEATRIQQRLAAMRVRSICNQHKCSGNDCAHPNHRRDVDYLLSEDPAYPGMLDMLGLPREYPDITEKDRTTWLAWLRQSGPPELDDLKDVA